jgi:hypothetical protein
MAPSSASLVRRSLSRAIGQREPASVGRRAALHAQRQQSPNDRDSVFHFVGRERSERATNKKKWLPHPPHWFGGAYREPLDNASQRALAGEQLCTRSVSNLRMIGIQFFILWGENEVNEPQTRRSGSRGRTRTADPAVNSRLLYRLSYSGTGA